MKKYAFLVAALIAAAGTGCSTHAHTHAVVNSGGNAFATVDMSGNAGSPSTALQYDPASRYEDVLVLDRHESALENLRETMDVDVNDSIPAEAVIASDSAGIGSAASFETGGLNDSHVQSSIVSNNEVRADSSIRGGSNQARGVDFSGNLVEPDSCVEPRVKADSSIRGGSDRARGLERKETGAEAPTTVSINRSMKADSPVRGASDRARGWNARHREPSFTTQRSGDSTGFAIQTGDSIVTREGDLLYKNNPAQGRPVTGEVGVGASVNSDSTAEQVRKALVAEQSGLSGPARKEVARNIKVSAENGIVTLRGAVPSDKDRKIMEVRARDVKGVREVRNELSISPSAFPAYRDEDAAQSNSDR